MIIEYVLFSSCGGGNGQDVFNYIDLVLSSFKSYGPSKKKKKPKRRTRRNNDCRRENVTSLSPRQRTNNDFPSKYKNTIRRTLCNDKRTILQQTSIILMIGPECFHTGIFLFSRIACWRVKHCPDGWMNSVMRFRASPVEFLIHRLDSTRTITSLMRHLNRARV